MGSSGFDSTERPAIYYRGIRREMNAVDAVARRSIAARLPLGMGMSKRAELALAIAIGLAVVAVRAPLMDLPLERDEGEYAYIGWRLAHGEIPYRDWFNQKPPGAFFVYGAALLLPGDPVVAIRLVAAVFAAASSIALFFLVRPLLGRAPAVLAAALLGLLGADPWIQGPMANTEIFMLPGIVAGCALFVRAVRSPSSPLAAAVGIGALLGFAIACKQVAAVNLPLLVLAYPLAIESERRQERFVRFVAGLALGGALVWGPLLAWLIHHGALDRALDAILFHNIDYASALSLTRRLENLFATVGRLAPTQALAWGLALVGLTRMALTGRRFAACFLAGWWLVSAVGVSASGQYFPHYFQQLLPPTAALASGVVLAFPARSGWQQRALVALLLLALAPPLLGSLWFWRMGEEEIVRRIYPYNEFEVMPAIAAEIGGLTGPDDRVFVYGTDPELLFYARRVSATRYIHLFPLFGPYPDARKRQREVLDEIVAADPAVIAWIPNTLFDEAGSPRLLTRRLERLLDARYRPYAVVVRTPQTRGRMIRAADDPQAVEDLRERHAWATLYLRRPGVGLPAASSVP